jgi:hypothetical protein
MPAGSSSQTTATTLAPFRLISAAQGIVESLARPGGNATGFFATEPSAGGKWLELLKEIVPGFRRVGVIFNPETSTGGASYLHSVETAAPLFSVEATGAPVHNAGDIELAISSLVCEPGGGLIVLPDAFTADPNRLSELRAYRCHHWVASARTDLLTMRTRAFFKSRRAARSPSITRDRTGDPSCGLGAYETADAE